MGELTFFTVTADFRAVAIDSDADVDADPQIGPVSAVVTFTPVIAEGSVWLAPSATPRPTAFVATPIAARIGSDGRLKLRDAPDGAQVTAANFAALPATGSAANYYVTTNTGTYYRWSGSGYVEVPPFQPVRLLADTALLNLPSPLYYEVSFSSVNFNGRAGKLKSFRFQAPTFDTTVSLVNVIPQAGETGPVGFDAPMLVAVSIDENNELVFLNADGRTFDPVPLPEGIMVIFDNGDATWSVYVGGSGS